MNEVAKLASTSNSSHSSPSSDGQYFGDYHFVDFDTPTQFVDELDGDSDSGDDKNPPSRTDDRTHRPTETFDFDCFLPNGNPLAIVDVSYTPAPSPEPIRGRSRHRLVAAAKPPNYIPTPVGSSVGQQKGHIYSSTRSMSGRTDSSDPSIFDEQQYGRSDGVERYTGLTQVIPHGGTAQDKGYDLKPPPPSHLLENIEYLSERFFSVDHLRLILRDHSAAARFLSFCTKYRPSSVHALEQYVRVQKALSAIEYANAIAESLNGPGAHAAVVEDDFEVRTTESVDELVNDALPGYLTYSLVKMVTEVLVKEITGQSTPMMRDAVSGLAEVYCLTDPALPDNPIVYASEEFYRCTQYGKDYVIGRNCRFLQGPKSSGASVKRLIDALSEGQEICETILNYRRDGSPFLNLLMIAPLYDNKGSVRYFIGAQIDINGLIEGGKGFDTFQRLLKEDRIVDRYGGRKPAKDPTQVLGELAGFFDQTEHDVMMQSSSGRSNPGSATAAQLSSRTGRSTRRYIGMDDPTDKGMWPAPHLGPSGRLPGVFQNYLLLRPYPSLRITFTSPALRLPGLLQSKFFDRIGGDARIRDQILDAFMSAVAVTARIKWLPNGPTATDGQGNYVDSVEDGEPRWIHATPLTGSDEKVGVWMVVMIDRSDVASLSSSQAGSQQAGSTIHDQHHRRGTSTNNTYPGGEARDGIQRARDAKARGAKSATSGGTQPTSSHSTRPGSPKVFPETIPINAAFGGGMLDNRTARAKMIAERAMSGEDQFREL